MSTFLFAISKHSPVIRATVEDDTSNLSAEKLTYYREGRRRPGEKKWAAWLILFRGGPQSSILDEGRGGIEAWSFIDGLTKPTCLAMSNDSLLTLNTYLIKNEIISIITSVE